MTQAQLPEEVFPDNDQTRARREHLDAIRALVGNVYPNKFARSRVTDGEDTITDVVTNEQIKALVPQVEAGARPTAEQLEAANAALKEFGTVRVSGRVAVPPRVMGKAAFVHLSDGKERLQIYVRKDDARAISNDTGASLDEHESGWRLFQLLDHGDFVGVAGYLFVTKTGELSVHVQELQFLAKALVPMPDKVHGINDPEIGRRYRYVDLIAASLKVDVNKDEAGGATSRELSSREVFERRSRLITEMRHYLDAHGYLEVETPMLTPIASGAAARPFKTHHNALDIDLYARIAPELYLKRLLVGGFERVYELNRNFRNEGIGYRWNPEFTMLEFYCAYMDVNGMMDFCEAMLRTTIEEATAKTKFRFGNEEIDFGRKFERLSMIEAIINYFQPRWQASDDGELQINHLYDARFVRRFGMFTLKVTQEANNIVNNELIGYDTDASGREKEAQHYKEILESVFIKQGSKIWSETEEMLEASLIESGEPTELESAQTIANIFGEFVETELTQPTFIHDFPKDISPLSKASPENPSIAERFELFAGKMEIANGFSELNDPVEQYERFEDQARQRERGDEEAMQMDVDYVRALSYGMPPAAGIGIGIDRLVMLLTNRRSIRDVILFPHMRPQRQAEEQTDTDAQA
ncbi:MAG: lysine--tRNA ligase [Pyrinomonadaceae bacterium]